MDLKFTARQLEKQSLKLESMEKAERKKIIDVSSSSLNKHLIIILNQHNV